MRFVLYLTSSLFCILPAVAQSQTAFEAPETITEQCLPIGTIIDLSKQNSPDARIARAQIGEAESDITAANKLFEPQLSVFGRSGVGDTGITDSGVSNQIGVRASQRVFDFGDSKFAKKAAQAGLEAQQFQLQSTANTAVLSTLRSIIDYQQSLAQSELTGQRRNFFREQKTLTEALLSEGGATLTELANVSSRLAEAESFYQELQFVQSRSQTQIRSDTLSSRKLCSGALNLEELFPVIQKLQASGYAKQVAREQSPFLLELSKRIENLDATFERQKRSRLPVISIVGTGSYASFDRFDDFQFRDRLGLDISVPLTGGTILSEQQRASARSSIARAEYSRALRAAEENIDITLHRIKSLKEQLVHLRETEKQMKLRFDSAQIEKGAGVRTLQDLIEVRLEYEQAGLTRISAEFEVERQLIVLLEQVGISISPA